MEEISWDTEDGEPLIIAKVIRSTPLQDELVVLYQGADRYTNQPYNGRINLRLQTLEQVCQGTYSHLGKDVAFVLTGCFVDTTFTVFEGVWSEAGWSARFSML